MQTPLTPKEHKEAVLTALKIIVDNISINIGVNNWQVVSESVGYGRGYLAAIRHLGILSDKELEKWRMCIMKGKISPKPKRKTK